MVVNGFESEEVGGWMMVYNGESFIVK